MADQRTNRNIFLIHLAAYVVVNAILAYINLSEAVPEGGTREIWFIWPLAGWGIGVAAHGLAYWIETRAREGQLLADPDVRGVAVHLFVYLAVNALLIVVNVVTSPGTPWSIWPVLGWGVGLAAHGWLVYRKVVRGTVERYAAEQELLGQLNLKRQANEIASSLGLASAEEDEDKKEATKAPVKRRRQAAAKFTKRAAARKGAAPKRAAAKSSGTAKRRKGPASLKGKTSASRSRKPK